MIVGVSHLANQDEIGGGHSGIVIPVIGLPAWKAVRAASPIRFSFTQFSFARGARIWVGSTGPYLSLRISDSFRYSFPKGASKNRNFDSSPDRLARRD